MSEEGSHRPGKFDRSHSPKGNGRGKSFGDRSRSAYSDGKSSAGRTSRFDGSHNGSEGYRKSFDRRNPNDEHVRGRRVQKDSQRGGLVIPEDVTGRELGKEAWGELRSLTEENRERVAQYLVMAGALLEENPARAYEYAKAAAKTASRVAVVREAVGICAYRVGDYHAALRELRTFRRLTADNTHLPIIVDCERAVGRLTKALETATEVDAAKLSSDVRVELAIVVSGVHRDQHELQQALEALNIPELNPRKAFSYSPRLFRAYAIALRELGDENRAVEWDKRADQAERALIEAKIIPDDSEAGQAVEIVDVTEQDHR